MLRFWGLVGVCLLLITVSSQSVLAQEVDDETTEASSLTFPQISSGPGLITPDSPFYFLDKAYQNFRLSLLGSQDRAVLRSNIAGERMAELRLMMAEDNERGIRSALNELANEQEKAVSDLSLAKGEGDNIEESATLVNQTIKEQRKALKELIDQARGELKLRLETARLSLKESKTELEDDLPDEILTQEIEEDLAEIILEETGSASDSAKRLEHAIMRLDELASQAAMKDQERRFEALQRAIDVKNDALLKQREKILELEERKAQRLLELQQKKEEAVSNARRQTDEAFKVIEEAEQEIEETDQEIEREFKDLEKKLPPQAKANRE